MDLRPPEIEAANRAEATATLIRCGYRVYRPEADVDGEDLILRNLRGGLIKVQLKGRLTVDWDRYGKKDLWMFFPNSIYEEGVKRVWYLVPHDKLFRMAKAKHGHTPGWAQVWSTRTMSVAECSALASRALIAPMLQPAPG